MKLHVYVKLFNSLNDQSNFFLNVFSTKLLLRNMLNANNLANEAFDVTGGNQGVKERTTH